MFNNPVIAGTLGGIASALLFLGAARGTALAIPFMIFAPLPLMIVSLGWAPIASVLACVALFFTLSILTTPIVGLIAALVIGLPSICAAYYYGLSRPAEEVGGNKGETAWFPISLTFTHALGVLSVGLIASGLITGFSLAEFHELIRKTFDVFINAQPSANREELLSSLSPEKLDEMAASLAKWLPISIGATWVGMLVINWSLGEKIARSSNRLNRPHPNLALSAELPKFAAGIFAIGVIVFVLGGFGSSAGAVIAGVFGAGFALIGLAVLHNFTTGMPARVFVLTMAYSFLFIFGFPVLFYAALGLIDTFIGLRKRSQAAQT